MQRILVVGGQGAFGRDLIGHFKSKGWSTISADLVNSPLAHQSVTLSPATDWKAQANHILSEVDAELDLVVCAAGAWAGGDARDANYLDTVQQMFDTCLHPAISSTHIAAHRLRPKGLLVLTGAQAALGPTPGMMGYGLAKAATHHLTQSVAPSLPDECKAVAVLPVTMDTPNNRKFMPDADHSSWTPLSEFSSRIAMWADNVETARSGSLYEFTTTAGKTTVTEHTT